MAHVSTIEQGGITSVSTQLAQDYPSISILAGQTFTTTWLLTRGAPRILVHSLQDVGALGAVVTVQAAISDNDTGTARALDIEAFVSPLNTPMVRVIPLPTKLCRLSIAAPAGQAVRLTLALMAAQ